MSRESALYFLMGTWPEGDSRTEHMIRQSMLSMRLEPVPRKWIDKAGGFKEFTK